jgi:hypothetical protein
LVVLCWYSIWRDTFCVGICDPKMGLILCFWPILRNIDTETPPKKLENISIKKL